MGIEQYLQQILSARYGKDVRQSIHDSIYEINEVAKKAEYDASTAPESAKAYAQAALASEQAAEDYKTAAEQAAEQAMSGTPEGYADLVAKVNSIYRQTATSYNVVGTSEGSALAHTIYGMSVQNGTPTPSVPVEIQSAKADFKCVGKNLIPYPYHSSQSLDTGVVSNGVTIKADLFNKNRISFVGTSTGRVDAYIIHPYMYKALNAGTYKLTIEHISGSNRQVNIAIEYGIGQTYNKTKARASLGSTHSTYSTTFTVTQEEVDTYNMAFALYGNNGQTYNDVYEVELTLADVDQTYEPYQHTDVTTNITLRAIEVTSSDDYNLVRDGKYYIADTVDWSEDRGYEITRRVGEWILDGSSDETWSVGGSASNYDCFTPLPNLKDISDSNYVTNGITNRFSEAMSRNSYYGSGVQNYDGYSVMHSGTYNKASFAFRVSGVTTVNQLRTWLASNPVTLVNLLDTPTTEPITSEQAQALLSLKTYDEATSINATGDIEPSLDLEYSKDRNTALALTGHNLAHKNALKLNDINTALIELGGN